MSLKKNWAISSFGVALGIVVAVAAAGPLVTSALAETAPAAAQPAQPAQPELAQTQWVKICDPQNANLCQITEDYALAGATSPISSVLIQTSPDANKFSIGLQVPIGIMLQAGIPLAVDGAKKVTVPFITCLPSPQGASYFCLAQAPVDGNFIAALKKGKALQAQLVGMDKKVITVAFPLDTFAGSFDGPDQAALARQREDAAKVLAEKAKERAKQLEGQQPK
jgi:invasion protein IalB